MRNDNHTVVCAWCNRVLHQGASSVSHGICTSCADGVLRAFEQLTPHEGQRRAADFGAIKV